MNAVRRLRRARALTQQALAARAGTSQATIAAYEVGTKSPTLKTLERLASSLQLEPSVTFVPVLTREDRRSLAYHLGVAAALTRDPAGVRRRAWRNLRRLARVHPHAAALFGYWRGWLALPTDELIARLSDPGPFARDMRQVSPFAGTLDAAERARVIKDARANYAP